MKIVLFSVILSITGKVYLVAKGCVKLYSLPWEHILSRLIPMIVIASYILGPLVPCLF